MELKKIRDALQAVLDPKRIVSRIPRFPGDCDGTFRVDLSPEDYAQLQEVVKHLELADLLNYKKAQEAFPKLLNACQLVLAIEANPGQNPTETIRLAPKTREQLRAAVRASGYPPHGEKE